MHFLVSEMFIKTLKPTNLLVKFASAATEVCVGALYV